MSDCGSELAKTLKLERKTLWMLLAINGVMFLLEALVGWWGQSAGLLADSLDMLADALVYGSALYAVDRSPRLKLRSAFASGIIQIALGIGMSVEILRRFLYGSEPTSVLMVIMGCVALMANVSCLTLLAKHREGGIHMRASWIFSTNDTIANIGVILSGVAVAYFRSPLPDLFIGGAISCVVMFGGYKILQDVRRTKSMSA